jgi:hypothetical protein
LAIKSKILIFIVLFNSLLNFNQLLNKDLKYFNCKDIIDFHKNNRFIFIMNENYFLKVYNCYIEQNNFYEGLATLRLGLYYNPYSKKIKYFLNEIIINKDFKDNFLRLPLISFFNLRTIIILIILNNLFLILINRKMKNEKKRLYFFLNIIFILLYFGYLSYPIFNNEAIVNDDTFLFKFPDFNCSSKTFIKGGSIVEVKYENKNFIFIKSLDGHEGWINKLYISKIFK